MIDFLTASGPERGDFYERNAAELGDRQFQLRRELEDLPSVLATGERVLAITVGDLADKKHLVVLTDRRLILLHKSMLGGLKQRSIDIGHIGRLEAERGLMSGQISFGDGSEISRLKGVPRKSVDPFMAKMHAAIDAAKRGVRLPSAETGLPQSMSGSAAPATPTPPTAGSKRLLRPLLATTVLAALVAGVVMTDTSDADSALPAPPPPVEADDPSNAKPTVRSSLSWRARELRKLHGELQVFRSDPRFHEVGFGPCCEFNGWLKRVGRLDRPGADLKRETGVLSGDLAQLGMIYMRSRGKDTKASRWLEAQFAEAFDPPARGPRRGIIVNDAQVCDDFNNVRQSQMALAANDAHRSNELLQSDGCIELMRGAIVGSPAATETLTVGEPGDTVSIIYHYVRMEDGRRLWVLKNMIDYDPAV